MLSIVESLTCIISKCLYFILACKTKIDLGFLIDGSGSINYYGAGNFQKCLEFVKSLTKAFVISPTDTRVGAIVFSYRSEVKFNFNQFTTQSAVEAAIDNIKYPGHSTYAGRGLEMAAEKLFGDIRKGVPRVLVVITDGWSSDDVAKPSEELKMSGVIILSVGLGTHYNKAQLNVMASYPKEDHVFSVDFSQMSSIVMAIQDKSCKGKGQYQICMNSYTLKNTVSSNNAVLLYV